MMENDFILLPLANDMDRRSLHILPLYPSSCKNTQTKSPPSCRRASHASITTLIMFCKPCSVPSYCQRLCASYSGGNHLSTGSMHRLSFPPFISFGKVPLPSFGFLARGVYRVPPLRFPLELRHCGTFRVIEPYPHSDVGSFPAVSPAEARLP